MKIAAITASQPYKKSLKKIENPTQSGEEQSIAFNGYWKVDGNDILKASSSQLRNYAEYFHELSLDSLKEIAKAKNFLGFRSFDSSMEALGKLKDSIAEVITQKTEWMSRVEFLEGKQNNLFGFLTKSEKEDLDKYKSWVEDLNNKSKDCYNKYYEESTSYDDTFSDPMDDPLFYRLSHYD